MSANVIHPAARYVQEVLNLWDNDREQTFHRSTEIVCRLIDAGFIAGRVNQVNRLPHETTGDEEPKWLARASE
jgi:hypothetical protein